MSKKQIIDSFFKAIIRGSVKIPYSILKIVKKNPKPQFLKEVSKAISDSDENVLIQIRPKKVNLDDFILYNPSMPKFAIVMQGPLRTEDNFTVETVSFYKQLYPNATIIVSSWEDENKSVIEVLKNRGAIVITNKKPEDSGHGNINYQLVNSKAGIEKAAEMGLKYVCKTRTDQRLNKPYVFEYMYNLLNQFPTMDKHKQNKRIITLSMVYGNMFFPYLVSDFLYFGHVEDIQKLFDIPLDNRTPFKPESNWTRRDYVEKPEPAEIYIMKRYLSNIGVECSCSVKDYWNCLKRYLICVDRKTIDLVWPKYEGQSMLNEYFGDYFLDNNEEFLKTMNFDFVNWFNLYSGTLKYNLDFEKYVDKKFR